MEQKTQFYIDGAWVDPVESKTMDVIDPATEKACAVISMGSKADVDKAVVAARKAFETFSETSKDERLALLKKLAEVMARRNDEMGEAIRLELGAPRNFADSVRFSKQFLRLP